MTDLKPEVLAIHQWIRDDAPVSMKMTITPKLIEALVERIQAARAEGLRSPSGGGEGEEGLIPGPSSSTEKATQGPYPALPPEWVEEAIRLAEIGEYLYEQRAFHAGDGYQEPRELTICWEWQQSKPHEYGQGVLLAEAAKWHDDLSADGIPTVASKLRAFFSPDGGEAVHGQVERDRSRDEPKDSLSGPTGEVGGVEPVAWRWRYPHTDWHVSYERKGWFDDKSDVRLIVQPLYAAPPPALTDEVVRLRREAFIQGYKEAWSWRGDHTEPRREYIAKLAEEAADRLPEEGESDER